MFTSVKHAKHFLMFMLIQHLDSLLVYNFFHMFYAVKLLMYTWCYFYYTLYKNTTKDECANIFGLYIYIFFVIYICLQKNLHRWLNWNLFSFFKNLVLFIFIKPAQFLCSFKLIATFCLFLPISYCFAIFNIWQLILPFSLF